MPRGPDLRGAARAGLDALRAQATRALKAGKRTHDVAAAQLERALHAKLRGRLAERATRQTIVVVAETAARVVRAEFVLVGTGLVAGAREVVERAVEQAAESFGRVGRVDAQLMTAAANARRAELEALRARTAAHSGQLASLSLRTRIALFPDIDRWRLDKLIREAMIAHSGESWRVDRLARTEAAYAYNAAQEAAFRGFHAPDGSRAWKRWTELVDDWTGAPKDARVGIDSVVMHGQIAPLGGLFTMPAERRAPSKMVGKTWAHPPNRPHDRAILIPWWVGCGIPGWTIERGHRRAV